MLGYPDPNPNRDPNRNPIPSLTLTFALSSNLLAVPVRSVQCFVIPVKKGCEKYIFFIFSCYSLFTVLIVYMTKNRSSLLFIMYVYY